MSPNEAQLRAALREGAGDGVDAGVIIANAERYRRARRQRITYAAAAAVVVAFVGVGGTLLAQLGSGGESAGSSSGTAAQPGAAGGAGSAKAPDVGTAPNPRNAPSATSSSGNAGGGPKAAACPSAPVRVVVPLRSRGERAGRLLPQSVATITACAYPGGVRGPDSAVFAGDQAQRLAATLEDGVVVPTVRSWSCPVGEDRAGRIALLPVDANGRRATTVLVTVRCGHAVASNGTATRYLTTVPPELIQLVR